VTSYEQIIYQVDDPVATITLNRPHALNAWTDRMGLEVRHAVAAAERDPRVVGIVITGAGRVFCAGADMNRLSAVSAGTDATETLPDDLASDPGAVPWRAWLCPSCSPATCDSWLPMPSC